MYTMFIGAICNIVLNPIFIFGTRMDVRSVALATILSQGVSCMWIMLYLIGTKQNKTASAPLAACIRLMDAE